MHTFNNKAKKWTLICHGHDYTADKKPIKPQTTETTNKTCQTGILHVLHIAPEYMHTFIHTCDLSDLWLILKGSF